MTNYSTAETIRTLRAMTGLSQEAIAAKLGYSRTQWNGWEAGRSEPRASVLIALLAEAGINVHPRRICVDKT